MDEMVDSEMDQQIEDYQHSEPDILSRGTTSISQPNNNHAMVGESENTTNADSHFLPDAYDNARVYGVPQYNGIQPPHNLDTGVPVATNLYYSSINPPSSTGVFHPPQSHRAIEQLPGSNTFEVAGGSSNNFGRSSSFMNDARGPHKRKIPKGIRGNSQDFNASSSSSSTAPPNARHANDVAIMDNTQFHIRSLVEVGPHGSEWSRPNESIMVHDHNHLIHGNYLGQHFPPIAPPWLFQQLNSNNNDGHATPWNQSLPMPCVQAPAINGSSLESVSMGLQRYHDPVGNRNGLRFPYHVPVNQQHHSYHHSTLPMQGVRDHSLNFHPTVTTNSFRVPTNPLRNVAIPTQASFEMGPRHVGPAPSSSLRIYRPHRGVVPETTLRHRSLPPMGFLRVNDLIALGERIGNVNTGLSEETITTQLKTKTYLTGATSINMEEEVCDDQGTFSCIICQDEFKNQEKIGVLQCEHEYHADCLRTWLVVKNVCPICKSEALKSTSVSPPT
ncbi:E3 ubiquitin ligase BIG BROTHER-related [Glycine soja]|nr:E3 ubiquitin ligase BIG BROTHER-related [Glycine soja]